MLGKIIAWLVVGALVGSLVGVMFKGEKKGYGRFKNLIIGLVGSVVGGLIFWVFKIDLGMGDLMITAEDLVAAFLGALVFLGVLALIKAKKS